MEKGVLTEREHEEIAAARDFLWRVRNALHFLSGQHQDQLTFEYQERIAADLGYRDDGHSRDVEQFMRDYYLHARTVNRFSDDIIARCTERSVARHHRPARRARHPRRRAHRRPRAGGRRSRRPFATIRALLLRVFADAQRHGVRISAATRRLIRAHAGLLDDARARRPGRGAGVSRRARLAAQRLRHAARDARARRARRLSARVRPPALHGAVRPLPHLHGRRAHAARRAPARAAPARRVQARGAAADPGDARGRQHRDPLSRHAVPRRRQGAWAATTRTRARELARRVAERLRPQRRRQRRARAAGAPPPAHASPGDAPRHPRSRSWSASSPAPSARWRRCRSSTS